MHTKRGFTLVELMIVISILGILAALVVPQFSSSTAEAKNSALETDLAAVRRQIELYRHDHNETLPAAVGETGADFTRRMTTKTDANGDPGTRYGPYFLKMPENPFNDQATVRVGDAAAGANTHGWRFDPITGVLQPDDNCDADADGTPDHVNL